MKPYLLKELIIRENASIDLKYIAPKEKTMIYVLGGSEQSLEYRYKTAGMLFRPGIARKIYFLDVPGITEYSLQEDRNLSNNEWSLRLLKHYGVESADVESVSVPSGSFGTLAEAREILRLARKNDYRHVILVTSSYHTMRAYITFFRIFKNGMVHITIRGSTEDERTWVLVLEFLKLNFYRHIMLPLLA